MMLELSESEDLSNHSPIIGDFNMLKKHAIMSGGPRE
jgi:hypothetical protein